MTIGAVARVRIDEPLTAPGPTLILSPHAWKEAFPGLRVRDLDDGAPVYRQGDAVDAVFVIERGYVRLCVPGPRGRDATSGILSACYAFGPVLQGGARASDSALAHGPVRVYRVPGADFRRALGSPLADQIVRVARARERLLARRLARLATLPAPQRVLATLAELLVHHGTRCDHGEMIHLRLGAAELADMAGAIPPQARMTLSALRRRGFVRCTHGFICVSKLPLLLWRKSPPAANHPIG